MSHRGGDVGSGLFGLQHGVSFKFCFGDARLDEIINCELNYFSMQISGRYSVV